MIHNHRVLCLSLLLVVAAGCKKDDTDGSDADTEASDTAMVDGASDTGDTAVDSAVDVAPDADPGAVGLDERPSNTTCTAPERPPTDAAIELNRAFPQLSFQRPIWMEQAPGNRRTWYVIEQAGRIKTFEDRQDTDQVTVWADLTGQIESGGEKGLLGMAFHPDWPATEKVYLSYTTSRSGQLTSVISEFGLTADGEKLDPSSETEIFTLDQPFGNHNGGQIGFGPDGYLYAGFGDGGAANDPMDNAEDPTTILGSMIRIDVDGGDPYAIPDDNPFARGDGSQGRPEVYAWGLRNPWRFSWDRATGELYAGDVGQNAWEEISIIENGGDYGWNAKEGTHCFDTDPCEEGPWIDPVAEYGHDKGKSVTGGYVYRGSAIPSLVGVYLYADFVSGRIWGLFDDPQDGGRESRELLDTSHRISSFARAKNGELFILDYGSGQIYGIDQPQGAGGENDFPQTLTETGCVDPQDPTKPAAGLIPYRVNAPFWSDGAQKERYIAIPDRESIGTGGEDGWELPVGSVVVKSFRLDGALVETRLMVRHADGNWAGYSYEWNDQQTEATLLKGGKVTDVGDQKWVFPSRSDCLTCHTEAAGGTLGLKTAQINGPLTYERTGRRANQLVTLDAVGMFDAPIFEGEPAPGDQPRMPNPHGSAPLAERAKAYLHTNCSQCHRQGSALRSQFDVQWETPAAERGLCGVEPVAGRLGIDGAKLVDPGAPDKSLVHVRTGRRDANGMPPLASLQVDRRGVDLLGAWIRSLDGCP